MNHPELKQVSRLMVMPEDGAASVAGLIEGAATSVLIKMFTFDSPALLAAVQAARARGLAVRVMLNPRRSSGTRANDATMEALRASGVEVRWTSPHFAVTHEKSMVIDGRLALIATFNFMDKYFTRTRDYGLVTEDPAVVAQVSWQEQPYALPDDSPLLLSNANSRVAMARFIDDARHTLLVQHPKYSDIGILDRLLAARDRGVSVHVLCGGKHGISVSDMMDTFSALRCLARAGAHVRQQHGLRLHAKLLRAAGERALVGSPNIARSAVDLRRELGVVMRERHAVALLRRRFDADWDEARHYEAPDPMLLHLATAVDQLPSDPDPDLDHE